MAAPSMSSLCAQALQMQKEGFRPRLPPDEKHKYLQQAFALFHRAASQGDVEGMYRTAVCLKNGFGVNKSDDESFPYFLQAAQAGHHKAAGTLASCYYNGQGTAKSHTEAVKWYQFAAQGGVPFAYYGLGICYRYGHGIAKNDAEAVRLFRLSANDGSHLAAHQLGLCLRMGEGAPLDHIEAFRWFHFAASKGYAPAMLMLGLCYKDGHGVAQDYGAAESWLTQAAAKGNVPAEYTLGVILRLLRRDAEAFQVFLSAGNKGHALAQLLVALCLREGRGVGRNVANAREWLTTAAQNGEKSAAYTLALWDLRGVGAPPNRERALNGFLFASERGHAEATLQAAEMIERGDGEGGLSERERLQRCKTLYQKAAEAGQPGAFMALQRLRYQEEGGGSAGGCPTFSFDASAPPLPGSDLGASGDRSVEGALPPSHLHSVPAAYRDAASAQLAPSDLRAAGGALPSGSSRIVYVSHGASPRSQEIVQSIRQSLLQDGITVVDTQSLGGPGQWGHHAPAAIASSSAFVVLLDESYVGSAEAYHEANMAFSARKQIFPTIIQPGFSWDDAVVQNDSAASLSYVLNGGDWTDMLDRRGVEPLVEKLKVSCT